jgi:hypothetical protein
MGTGLLDLLPEVNELLSKVLKFIYINYDDFSFPPSPSKWEPGWKSELILP